MRRILKFYFFGDIHYTKGYDTRKRKDAILDKVKKLYGKGFEKLTLVDEPDLIKCIKDE